MADRFPNRAAAAEKAGISVSTLQNWIDGKYAPSFESIAHLAQAAGIRVEWIATGRGPMEADVSSARQQQAMGAAPPPAVAPLNADEDLDALESRLDTADAEQLEQARRDLLAIAGNDRLSPATRARADMLLDVRFGDEAAAQRRAAVERVVSDDIRDLGRRLQASEREAAWRPPPLVRAMLKELLYSHPGIGDDEITSLLRAMKAELVPEPRDPAQGP
nr:helix-turn-helix transcriptional regulator [Roseospira goensis]